MNNTHRIPLSVLALLVSFFFLVTSAQAGWYKSPKLSAALEANGFQTLAFALDATNLTAVLDENRVVVFAPTNDVFEDTATALGCTDALDLATRLLGIPVGDSNALATVLTHHAYLGRIRSEASLLRKGSLHMVDGSDVTVGVNNQGLYAQGAANASPSSITTGPITGARWTIFPIDQILLPFAPPANLCD